MRDENSWKVRCLVSCLDHVLTYVGMGVGRWKEAELLVYICSSVNVQEDMVIVFMLYPGQRARLNHLSIELVCAHCQLKCCPAF